MRRKTFIIQTFLFFRCSTLRLTSCVNCSDTVRKLIGMLHIRSAITDECHIINMFLLRQIDKDEKRTNMFFAIKKYNLLHAKKKQQLHRSFNICI